MAFGAHLEDVIEDPQAGFEAVGSGLMLVSIVPLIIITALYGLGLSWALYRGGSWARRPARALFPLWVSLAILFVMPYQVSDPWYAPAAWLLLAVSVAPSVALVIDARHSWARSGQRPEPQPHPQRRSRPTPGGGP